MSFHRSTLFSLAIFTAALGAALGCGGDRDRAVNTPTLPPVEGSTGTPDPAGATNPSDQRGPNPQDGTATTGPGASVPGTSSTGGMDARNGAGAQGTMQNNPGGSTTSGYGTPSGPGTPNDPVSRDHGAPLPGTSPDSRDTSGYPAGGNVGGSPGDPSGTGMATDAGVPGDGGTGDAGTGRPRPGGRDAGTGGDAGSR